MNIQTDTQRIQHLEKLVDLATGAISEFAHALNCKPDCESVLQAINDLKTRNRDLVSERNAAIAAERTWETTMMRVCGEDGPASVAEKFKALVAENVARGEIIERLIGQYGAAGYHAVQNSLNPGQSLLYDAMQVMKQCATDAAIAAIRAEGINFTANRLLAAYDHGFLNKPAKEVADVANMILSAIDELPNATPEDLTDSYSKQSLAEIAAQLRQEGANHE